MRALTFPPPDTDWGKPLPDAVPPEAAIKPCLACNERLNPSDAKRCVSCTALLDATGEAAGPGLSPNDIRVTLARLRQLRAAGALP